MSDDNLESLDNVSLRKKCLEYGLPNVPITNTSKALLIRKLRAAIKGEIDEKKKIRRETFHASKIPSLVDSNVNAATSNDETAKRPNHLNRRTIAATNVTSTVDDTTLSQPNKPEPVTTDKRRSVRAQVEPEAPSALPTVAATQKRKPAVMLVDEEEDEDDVILLEAAEQGEKEIIIPRARRSVSLSKTGVVTTSYSQESVAHPPKTVHETESESEYDYTSKYANLYEPITRPLSQTQPVTRVETSYGLSEPKVVLEPERTLNFRTTSVNRTSIEPEISYNKPSMPAPSRYSSLGSGYSSNAASSVTTSTTTRRYTSGNYGTATTTPATKFASMYDDQDEDQENQPQTPYLSDFARKLERLKAEPLVKGAETPRNVPIKRDTQRFNSNIVGRRSTIQTDSVADSFKNFLFALDRKYNLKRNLSILFVVVLLLFIYVVFIN